MSASKYSWASLLLPLALLLVAFVWQLGAQLELINVVLFPPPLQLLKTFNEMHQDFIQALQQTATAVGLSFVAAVVIGLAFALVLALLPTLQKIFLPLAIFFQTMPIIAIAPLLVIYFGFGLSTIVVSSTIVCVFPVMASSLLALTSTPTESLELFQFLKASRLQTLLQLRLPAAYLGIYSGLRIAAGLAVVGAVAGEFVAGGGLGGLIDVARTQQRIDIVFCCLLLLSLLGLAMVTILRLLHSALQKWRPFATFIQQL